MTIGCLKLISVVLEGSRLRTLDLGLAPNIEELILVGCKDLENLHLPGRCLNLRHLLLTKSKLRTLDIGLTPNLEKLNLKKSYCLEELHMANECQKLNELEITHSNLRTLDLGMTPNLKKLVLIECRKLVELHTPFGCLKKFVHVDLSGCLRFRSFKFNKKDYTSCSVDESLEVGPLAELYMCVESIERCLFHPDIELPKFQFFRDYKEDRPSMTRYLERHFSEGMCACTNLETFSQSICGLRRLRKLVLAHSFVEVINDLDLLESLEELILYYTKIKHLPDSILMLKRLKYLKLYDCSLLENLPEDLGQLECLEKLHLTDRIFGQLECLEKLHLTDAKIIKHLPDSICMLKRLKDLQLYNCLQLEKLPEDLGQLECLEELNLQGSERLQDIPKSILLAIKKYSNKQEQG
uniref:R13L1/DRL21-like LRR repeat region domain-containing protein n=1 Tax=Lactuca sativa TaxID=4236 RepID=A0A9R1VV47_LACSA|nr:hypothetical protein LSAT_V11C400215470 [Lactuca sativa]